MTVHQIGPETRPVRLTLATGDIHQIVVKRAVPLTLVELPDVLFHLNSAVPCLDEQGSLLHALAQAFIHSLSHPDDELVVVGHADTSGEPRVNYPLSELRAQAVLAILTGDDALWEKVVTERSKVEDYQRIFKSLATLYYWDCDPGEVDDQNGEQTRAAVKGFQREANAIFGLRVTADGAMGPETWRAILRVYRLLLEQHGFDIGHVFKLGNDGRGFYGCGESFPIEGPDKDDFVSATNRRVEIYFGPAAQLRPLNPPPSLDTNLTAEDCVLFNPEVRTRSLLGVQGSLSARHVDTDGAPLAGVTARLVDSQGKAVGKPQVTNARGFVFWSDLPDGDYLVGFDGADKA